MSATFAYDSCGQRTQSDVTVNGTRTITDYSYEGITLLRLQATQGASSWQLSYLYDEEGVPYAAVYRSPAASTAPVVFAMVTTDRGDVVELLDSSGAPFAAYRYDPWGKPTSTVTQGTALIGSGLAAEIAARQVLRYAGYVYDPDIGTSTCGTYYLSARQYDPATRQFLSKDLAKADGEESAYQYCGGDPVGLIDPTGEAWWNPLSWRLPGWAKHFKWVTKVYRVYRLVEEVHTFVTIERDVYRTSWREEVDMARKYFLARKAKDPVSLYEEVFDYDEDMDLTRLDHVSGNTMLGWAQTWSKGPGSWGAWHAAHNRVVSHRIFHRKVVSTWKLALITVSLWLPV